jgi:hypothetical protein
MSNGQIHPAMNAAQGSLLSNTAGLSSQQMQLALQQMQYNNAGMSANPPVVMREGFTKAPRLYVEVDVVTNGFVLAVGSERLIAKNIEELQQHFVAQVASLLLEKDK